MCSEQKIIVFVLGPTAVGKSALALRLARRCGGEIVNCDSMQVYRGFDIGTDKLPASRREGIPHHLLDIVEPNQQFTAAEFVAAAVRAIGDIRLRNRLPILAGGTGLYAKALINGLFPQKESDPSVRANLEREADERGLAVLWNRLRHEDPDYSRKIGPNDRIRILRALEVLAVTGRNMTRNFDLTRSSIEGFRLVRIALEMPREELKARIHSRVEGMFGAGLVDEVRGILGRGIPPSAPPFRGLGYRRVIQALRGEISFDQAVELTKVDTRQYAKRQMTWFRKMNGLRWFQAGESEAAVEYAVSELSPSRGARRN